MRKYALKPDLYSLKINLQEKSKRGG